MTTPIHGNPLAIVTDGALVPVRAQGTIENLTAHRHVAWGGRDSRHGSLLDLVDSTAGSNVAWRDGAF